MASALFLVVPLVGCSREEVSHASQSAKDAASATGDKLVELKDKFVAATQKEMDELSVKYKQLEDKAAAATADAKQGIQSTMDDIRAKKDELTREFEESKRAHDGSTFEAAKAKVKDGLADLRKRIDDALDADER
jgi:hypothetical protein